MDTPYLQSDESIILTTQDLIVSGVRMEAILTSKRLILVESRKDRIHHEDIPLATIGSVMAGENAFREATITLSITPSTGETKTVELIFFRRPGVLKNQERDRWVIKLKEHRASSLPEATRTEIPPLSQGAEAESTAQPPAQKPTPAVSSKPPGPPSPVATLLDRIPIMAIPAIIVVIVAVAGGAFFYIQYLHEKSAGQSGPAPIPAITTEPTAIPAPDHIPDNPAKFHTDGDPGSYVTAPVHHSHNRCLGTGGVCRENFTGSVGARGSLKRINATGDQLYQVPARNDIVDVSIQKEDGSGNMFAVEVYNNGAMVKRRNMTTPWGLIDLHIDLKTM